jgi:uncharacterized protein (DUF2141 family)
VLVVGLAACGGGDDGGGGGGGGPFALTFDGTMYTPHSGMTLDIQVIDNADGSIIKSDSAGITGDTISFTWPDLLEAGGSYDVRWYVDVDGNGFCNQPPEDHSWVRTISDVSADVTLTHPHDTDLAPVCDTFGDFPLTFTGSEFTTHEDNKIYAAVIASDDTIVAMGNTTVASGAFSLEWSKLLRNGESYKLRFYADVNGNGMCDAPPDDHVWEKDLGTITAAKTFDFPHDANLTDVCATFNP